MDRACWRLFLPALLVVDIISRTASSWTSTSTTTTAAAAPPTCVRAGAGGICHSAVCCAICTSSDDCTTEMQAALDSPAAHTVVFSARTWVTTPLHLTRNHTKLIFAPGSLVLAKQGAFHGTNDDLFAAYVTTNLTISGYGATWRMRRSDYNNSLLYAKSEGRHGLNLMGCRDTVIEGLRIELTGGDGISVWKGHKYVKGKSGVDYCPTPPDENPECACVNLLIRDVVCHQNYRQGISVMLAENMLVENSVFSDTAGTPPAAGVATTSLSAA